MARLGAHLRYFVRKKIAEDPAWQRPHIIFSGRLNFLAIIGDHVHVCLACDIAISWSTIQSPDPHIVALVSLYFV